MLMRPTLVRFSFLFFGFSGLFAQNEPMQVIRCLAIEPDQSIRNIYVDESNQKWVGNGSDVYQVKALDLANKLVLKPGEQSLLAVAGGNADVRWNNEQLQSLLKIKLSADNQISTGYYDTQKDLLILGTSGSGFFELKTKPSLQLVGSYTTANSKLRSNHINLIYADSYNKIWVGTDQGLLQGSAGKWELVNKYFNVSGLQTYLPFTYVLSDGQLWRWDGKGEWEDYGFDERMIEGSIEAFALDVQGRFWVASEILARYDPESDKFQTFGPADYYTSQFPSVITLDKEGAIWVGTDDKGVYLVEKASAMTLNLITGIVAGCDPKGMTIKAKITGGKAPFTYQWSNGQNVETAKDLGPGEYAVTVTDAAGLSKNSRAVLPDPRIILKVSQQSEESGANAKDGVAAAIATGGSPSYTYLWDNGETSNIARKLAEGAHTVVVKDKLGCSAEGTVNITQKTAALRVVLAEKGKLNCNGDKSAALALTVSGGKAPFQYQWSNPALSGEAPTGLAAGDYQVTVTDATGQKTSSTIKIDQPAAISLNLRVQTPASTNNADGKAQAQVSGGTAPYTYSWDNGENTTLASKLAPGQHNVTVTDSKGCRTQGSIEISENVLALNANLRETKKLDCAGAKDAALQVEVNGGKAPFTYAWSIAGNSGTQVSNLAAGEYSVTVSDASGKNVTATAKIEQPAPLQVQVNVTAPASTNNADGKATAQVSGGTSAYSYRWDNGETLPSASKLAPGKHSVTITDAKGCKAEASTEISENILALEVKLAAQTAINCNGAKEGALQANVSGGKEPYTYSWSAKGLSGNQVKGLAAGEYSVSVSDASGKTASTSIKLEQPNAILVKINVLSPASTNNADGKANAQASGGSGAFTYKWDNGETLPSATKLSPGTHTLSVTDAKGCTSTANVDITENILPLVIELEEKSSISCFGAKSGAILAKVQGGKAPYRFQWSDPNTRDEAAIGLSAGNYSLTVTDATGAQKTAQMNLNQPEAMSLSLSKKYGVTAETAKDGLATVQVKGGTGPLKYAWSTGETLPTAQQLGMGKNTVTVTDAKGCTATLGVDINKKNIPELTAGRIRNGQAIRVEQLQFDIDSINIKASFIPILDEVFEFLTDNPGITVEVGGHTNGLCQDEFCIRLSTARAKSVAEYLINKGIDAKRVLFKGYGRTIPIATNSTPEGRQKNQRVEIKIVRMNG
jgi:outer membrane protein OmpA-like peptidoglycan-associated protein